VSMDRTESLMWIREQLPGWTLRWDTGLSRYQVEQPGDAGLVVEASTAELLVGRARALVRLQEAMRALFGDTASAMLSDPHWPGTRKQLEALCLCDQCCRQQPIRAHQEPAQVSAPVESAVRTSATGGQQREASVPEQMAEVMGGSHVRCPACGEPMFLVSGTCALCPACGEPLGGCG